MKEILKIAREAAIITLIGGPISALAQTQTGFDEPPPAIGGQTQFQDLIEIVNKFLGWLFTVLIVVAAIFIVMAAFYYLTAGGDEEKVGKAKDRLIYAVVAIAIGLVATSVKFVVAQLVGSNADIDVN
jgi:hypothetical protein